MLRHPCETKRRWSLLSYTSPDRERPHRSAGTALSRNGWIASVRARKRDRGSPAVLGTVLQTGGFASPPFDGFAFITQGPVSKRRGWQSSPDCLPPLACTANT